MKQIDPQGLIKSKLIDGEDIRLKVKQLAAEISRDYRGKCPLMIGILRGAFIFLSDLVRELQIPAVVDFMSLSSYGTSTESSGVVRILKDLEEEIEGRDVIVVEDIIDTGLTLKYLIETLKARNPASLEVCALLVKEGKQQVDISARYVGFRIPDEFVVGYGLDFAEKFRQLSGIYAIDLAKIERCR